MTELIEWFNNIFNNCYYVKHEDYPNSLFMYYDLNYVRKLKLNKIGGNISLPPKTIIGECVFEQDWKNQYLWCKYSVIWKYLEDNYSNKYIDVQQFIKDRLEEYDKMKVLTPSALLARSTLRLEEYDKMKVLTPRFEFGLTLMKLEEYDKMKVLTPAISGLRTNKILREYFKMNVITPNIYHVKCK